MWHNTTVTGRSLPWAVPLVFALSFGASASVEASQPMADRAQWTRAAIEALVDSVSADFGLDAKLVHSVVRVESNYDPQAVSRKGAMGLMQLMPATARRLAVGDPFDPRENVRGGVTELSRLLAVYDGSLALALAAYNAGEGAVSRCRGVPPFAETRGYVARVISLYTGRPYTMDPLRLERASVQMVRDPASGRALITNLRGSTQASSGVRLSRTAGSSGVLRGGFGAAR